MILWLPVIVPLMFLSGIAPFLAMVAYFLHDVYSTLKRTVASGELSYPFLAKAGAVVAVILTLVYASRSQNRPFHLTTSFVLGIGFVFIFTVLPALALGLHWILKPHSSLSASVGKNKFIGLFIAIFIVLAVIVRNLDFPRVPTPIPLWPTATSDAADVPAPPEPTALPNQTESSAPERALTILVDDFIPQPYQGDAVYFYNRLEGDRGALNNSIVAWQSGAVDVSISNGNTWGGLWMSLNHPIREGQAINFSAVLPRQIRPAYQARITGINVSIFGGSTGVLFRVELKDSDNNLQWSHELILNGEQQEIGVDLPPLQEVNHLVLVLDRARAGDKVIVENISFTAATPVTDIPTAAFVWSYGMLLENWNPSTGLVRDKARDMSGDFDAIQSTGSLAAATALADQLGVVDHADAVAIVEKIGDTLLNRLPTRYGLWPHWVKAAPDGGLEIVPGTEWSSVDTAIAALGLLGAQQSLGLDTTRTEDFLRAISWNELVTDKGLSHGYTYDGMLILYAWDAFGGESWLVELAYASATGQVAPLAYSSPPTANGSGFIDELAWLYVRPPTGLDYWGTDWASYRSTAAIKQISYYLKNGTLSCPTRLGLFGLSAAEAPAPERVAKENIYQAFGLGGQFAPTNDGTAALGSPAIVSHYSALIGPLYPHAATGMWTWLIDNGYFSPLNNVESLAFSSDGQCHVEWNHLKGSWNLALQTLAWGRYLVERAGAVPVLWQATRANQFLWNGYQRLAPDESAQSPEWSLDLSVVLKNANITCAGGSEYTIGMPGVYRYQIITDAQATKYYSLNLPSRNQGFDYWFAIGWPPASLSAAPGMTTTDRVEPETITTRLGTFQALRFDTLQSYRVQTMNHSDPNGTAARSEWFVCGLGLVRATMHLSESYQTYTTVHDYELELVSFTPPP